MVLYITDNLLAGADVAVETSSEDVLYINENLWNGRPSKPFRFTGHGSAGNPEWVCAEFDAPKPVTFAGLFNHNLTALVGANDVLLLKGCDDPCSGMGGCDWTLPDYSHSIKDRLITNWNDLYHTIGETRLAYRLEVIDEANPAAVELGELVFGEYTELSNARLKPGRRESPALYRQKHKTHYGQHWTESLSYNLTLELVISSLNDPAQVDAVRRMVMAVHAAGGHFVIVPDHRFAFCYYVALENDGGFMAQIARGWTRELTEWSFSLEALTKGISLL